jgi:outer membrane protein insertion porin family
MEQRIVSIEFAGNDSMDPGRLKAQMRASREGGVYRSDALKYDMRQLEAFYREQGFLRARAGEPSVESRDGGGVPGGVVIRIPLAEGPRYLLGAVSVKNARVLDEASIRRMSPLREGEPYSRGKMEEWRDKIAESYQSMGYLRFRGDLEESVNDLRQRVDVSLACDEGGVYRVRKIAIACDASINPAELKRKLLVAEGAVYNPEMLSFTVQFLNEMRIFKPISGSDIQLTVDEAALAVDIVLKLSPPKP